MPFKGLWCVYQAVYKLYATELKLLTISQFNNLLTLKLKKQ